MKLELIATATFGLEAVVRREVEQLGYSVLRSEDGKITYMSDERGIVRSNLWLRSADRVLLKMGEFNAATFEELFQQTKGIPWEQWISPEGKFTVNGTSVKSTLHHVPSCQSIVKKAIAQRLSENYGVDHLPETGGEHGIKVTLLKDRATLTMDTTGPGLHKRGYRVSDVEAPIKETLAAALVQLSFWNKDRILVDPCCGSGTIVIEAAMLGLQIPPGLNRTFQGEEWEEIPKALWKEERKKAFEGILQQDLQIQAFDLNPKAVEAALQNAEEAGVDHVIQFGVQDVKKLTTGEKQGILITNPPYGERIGDKKSIQAVYDGLRKFMEGNPTWSLFLITSDRDLEQKLLGRPANRRRKLYNGRIETTYYQYHGEKEVSVR